MSVSGSSPNYSHHPHHNHLSHQHHGYGVKSESYSSNYDYMNNCYFGGNFGALSVAAASAGTGAPELAGYHHQHNVIQAAKLMASS